MLKSDIEALCNLLNQKAELLEKYDDLSIRLLIDDYDRLDHILDVRNEFLLEFNKVTPMIDKIVAKQSNDEQEILKAMLKYKEIDNTINDDFSEIRNILIKMKKCIDSINEKTEKTTARFNIYKQELLDEMLKLNKSKKVIDFVGSTTKSDIFRGRTLDTKL